MTGRKGLLVKNAHGSVQWVQRRSEVRCVLSLHPSETELRHAWDMLLSE